MATQLEHAPCYIKVRENGRKAWAFLSRGGTSRLRIHAIRFSSRDRAQSLIDENAPDNPEWEWKIAE
jgi:predicted short-subunit dehydrogenase-like oxidoreductase (DUF2520 family)